MCCKSTDKSDGRSESWLSSKFKSLTSFSCRSRGRISCRLRICLNKQIKWLSHLLVWKVEELDVGLILNYVFQSCLDYGAARWLLDLIWIIHWHILYDLNSCCVLSCCLRWLDVRCPTFFKNPLWWCSFRTGVVLLRFLSLLSVKTFEFVLTWLLQWPLRLGRGRRERIGLLFFSLVLRAIDFNLKRSASAALFFFLSLLLKQSLTFLNLLLHEHRGRLVLLRISDAAPRW